MLQSVLNFLSSVAFFVTSVFGVNMSSEQQGYDVIERIGKNIEIRQYPPRIVAQTTMDTSKSDNPRGGAFRIVVAYIFGANKARQKIDMTAPVEIATSRGDLGYLFAIQTSLSMKVIALRLFRPHFMRGDQADE